MASHPRISAVVGDAQKSMANFDLNAIMRGAQLTVVGGKRFSFKYCSSHQADEHDSLEGRSESKDFQV